MEQKIQGESKLTFLEASSIIVGHGVGSGILAVPYLASRNSWLDIVLVLAVVYVINLLLHFMIAELSLNNGGLQFIKCFEAELFAGKLKTFATWLAFALLGLSVLLNVSGFIAGAAAVFHSWFGISTRLGMVLYYVLAALVVAFGMKAVGVCEKISVFSMLAVIGVLFVASFLHPSGDFIAKFHSARNVLALYGMVSFSLSAVMSVPQVVKGLQGDARQIRRAIAAGTGLNLFMIILITVMTLVGTGSSITEDGALVDLSRHLGGWVAVVGYIFTLLALSTSFWANVLNLRDIINEQTHWGTRPSYFAASLPCLAVALLGLSTFVGFTRLASVIQVLTGLGIILAYHRSRNRVGQSAICGRFGTVPFQILVFISSLVSTVGAVVPVA
jgi:amino acid permease